ITALDLSVHENVVQERRGLRAFVLHRVEREPLPRARYGHVKQPPLFLNMKTTGSDGLLFLHQLYREFEHAGLFSRGKSALHEAQDVNVVEFETLGRVHGHELYRVSGFLLEIDRSAGLIEIIQVLDEFFEALRFTFGLPLTHELPEALEIFPVFGS